MYSLILFLKMTKFQCILSTVDFQVLLILEENL